MLPSELAIAYSRQQEKRAFFLPGHTRIQGNLKNSLLSCPPKHTLLVLANPRQHEKTRLLSFWTRSNAHCYAMTVRLNIIVYHAFAIFYQGFFLKKKLVFVVPAIEKRFVNIFAIDHHKW